MRTIKDPLERRAEILDTAEKLFLSKSYAKTTIMDILNAIGIAKGTFYYYFKSKEEVLDAIIGRIADDEVLRAKELAKSKQLTPPETIIAILLAQTPQQVQGKQELLEQFKRPSNAEMQQKSLVAAINGIGPVLASVVEEGNQQGIFHCPYPAETINFLLAGAELLFDNTLFPHDEEQNARKAEAFIQMMEHSLGAKPGTFTQIKEVLPQ